MESVDVQGIWDGFAAQLEQEYAQGVRPLPNESLDLLVQAILAHKGGAYSAAAIVCRASVEAAGIQALYLQRTGPRSWSQLLVPLRPDGEPFYLQLGSVLKGLKLYGVLDESASGDAQKVKDAGDRVAHTVERQEREFKDFFVKLRKAMQGNGKIEDIQTVSTKISEQESADLIAATSRVLLAVYRGVGQRSGPTGYLHSPEPSSAD